MAVAMTTKDSCADKREHVTVFLLPPSLSLSLFKEVIFFLI